MTDTDKAEIKAHITAETDRLLAALAGNRPSGQSSAPPITGGGATLPNYGKSKGQPIATASDGDLAYYASGCRKSLDNPDKARWHDNERRMLTAIEAEIARRSGGASTVGGGFVDDSDIPF